MKKKIKYTLIILIILALIVFNVIALSGASKRNVNVTTPKLNEYAMAIYGTVEPLGKAISVSPKVNGIVTEIYAQEGDAIRKEQPICAIESTDQNSFSSISYVTSPKDGLVYKLDIRIGESFRIGDIDKIIVGSPELQIACDVEALWIGKIRITGKYDVYNAETGESIGTATFHSASKYLRPKTIRAEQPGESFSTDYQEVIMNFSPLISNIPINLPVMVKVRNE
jgi:biotin carboxyl carrier protein